MQFVTFTMMLCQELAAWWQHWAGTNCFLIKQIRKKTTQIINHPSLLVNVSCRTAISHTGKNAVSLTLILQRSQTEQLVLRDLSAALTEKAHLDDFNVPKHFHKQVHSENQTATTDACHVWLDN